MGRKKRRHLQNSDQLKREVANRKRRRIIFGFIMVMIAFVILGVTFMVLRTFFASSLYHAFIYDWIGTALLYLAALTLIAFFVYTSLVITIKNPQKVEKRQLFYFGLTGIVCFTIGVFIVPQLSSLTINSVGDMKDYANGEMKVDDFKVVDVYTGGHSTIALITTDERELTLLYNYYQIEEGTTYRFTYMKRSGTILSVEEQ
jgi:cation transport ATPase